MVVRIPPPYDLSLDEPEDWEAAERALAAEVTQMPGRVGSPYSASS
jgi:hypothetical protein